MKLVLWANQEEYDKLNGYTFDNQQLQFVKDGLDRWIVNVRIIDNPKFIEIRNDLLSLPIIEYVEPIYEDGDIL
jgi:hypothetical protein